MRREEEEVVMLVHALRDVGVDMKRRPKQCLDTYSGTFVQRVEVNAHLRVKRVRQLGVSTSTVNVKFN